MKEIWKFIQDKLQVNKKLMLLIVIDSDGSSPGQPGFKMVVADDGTMIGSIGGGQTEYRLVEKAKKELLLDNPQISLNKEVHRPDVEEDRSGMICSGEQWIAFYPISAVNSEIIDSINISIEKEEKGIIHYNQDGFTFHVGETEHHKHQNPVTSPVEWQYKEVICKKNYLYIFGAGHVGLALSDMADKLNFVVYIFDNRKGINTMTMNKSARFKKVIDYKNVSQYVPDGNNIYVVIMTFGHKSDEDILGQFLDREIKYLGMMGSAKKVNAIFENLGNNGFSKETLHKVHAPIGLEIASQTPDEIAISVVAEMIKTKNT
jgi:xanthine dehydrogenase accessory factor